MVEKLLAEHREVTTTEVLTVDELVEFLAGVLLKALDQRIEERLAHLEAVMTSERATAKTFDFSPVKEPRQKEPSTATEDP